MSLLTILLIAALALTAAWLLAGLVDGRGRRAPRQVPGNVDRTAAQLFQRWSEH